VTINVNLVKAINNNIENNVKNFFQQKPFKCTLKNVHLNAK